MCFHIATEEPATHFPFIPCFLCTGLISFFILWHFDTDVYNIVRQCPRSSKYYSYHLYFNVLSKLDCSDVFLVRCFLRQPVHLAARLGLSEVEPCLSLTEG